MDTLKAVILLLAAGQGILLSIALLTPRKKSSLSNIFLGLVLLILSLELLNDWGFKIHYHSNPNAIPFWILQSYLIVPPALWFFVQLNTNASFTFRKIYLVAFVPGLIEIVAEGFNKFNNTGYTLSQSQAWSIFTEIIPPVATGMVLIHYAINLWRLNRSAAISFSGSGALQWVKLYGLFFAFTLLTFLWVLEVFFLLPVFVYVEFLLIALIFALGYVGYFQPDFFSIPVFIKMKTEAAGFSRYADKDELKKLERAFSEQKLHRQPKLSLEELAAQLKLPERYVSHLINIYHHSNFNNYVNGWRVKEVIEKINDPAEQHKTLLALALEAGFNSKSSFNQIFKAHTGRTPSELLPTKS